MLKAEQRHFVQHRIENANPFIKLVNLKFQICETEYRLAAFRCFFWKCADDKHVIELNFMHDSLKQSTAT